MEPPHFGVGHHIVVILTSVPVFPFVTHWWYSHVSRLSPSSTQRVRAMASRRCLAAKARLSESSSRLRNWTMLITTLRGRALCCASAGAGLTTASCFRTAAGSRARPKSSGLRFLVDSLTLIGSFTVLFLPAQYLPPSRFYALFSQWLASYSAKLDMQQFRRSLNCSVLSFLLPPDDSECHDDGHLVFRHAIELRPPFAEYRPATDYSPHQSYPRDAPNHALHRIGVGRFCLRSLLLQFWLHGLSHADL